MINKQTRKKMTEGVKRAGLERRRQNSKATEKHCKGCNITKSVDEFRKKVRDGFILPRSRCAECENKAAKSHRKANPEQVREAKKRWTIEHPDAARKMVRRRTLKSWGIENYNDILNWLYTLPMVCGICSITEQDFRHALSIDHCHVTNKVRGWLCADCNSGLGYFKDSKELLEKAKIYLDIS